MKGDTYSNKIRTILCYRLFFRMKVLKMYNIYFKFYARSSDKITDFVDFFSSFLITKKYLKYVKKNLEYRSKTRKHILNIINFAKSI